MKYYRLDKLLSRGAHYNIVFGERSNGKSYAAWEYGLTKWIKEGRAFAVVRRMAEDFARSRAFEMCSALVSNGVIRKLTNGKYSSVWYRAGRWYLTDDEGNKQEEPFAYAFALSSMEHDKSTSFPTIDTIIFDEFLTRTSYLPDEFVLFSNVVSTIVRQRNNVKIIMLGNTVDKYCPYFAEMGLAKIKQMKPGEIDVYTYGESALRVAVEYAAPSGAKGKPSDVYFAFNNPKLKMITGGEWEISIYPRLPEKYIPKQIGYTFWIDHDSEMLQCEIIKGEHGDFIYIHRKTTPFKEKDKDLIFGLRFANDNSPYRRVNMFKPYDVVGQRILSFFTSNKVFYASNDIGEIMRAYKAACVKTLY